VAAWAAAVIALEENLYPEVTVASVPGQAIGLAEGLGVAAI
jgi:hypothetical protein